jgi:hypothetical protein
MTVVATKITGAPDVVHGSERAHSRRLTFSGNYATGGEAITASTFGGVPASPPWTRACG